MLTVVRLNLTKNSVKLPNQTIFIRKEMNILNKFAISALLVCVTNLAVAGVLMSQWTEGTSRFCKYSDGEVVAISFGSTCSSSN